MAFFRFLLFIPIFVLVSPALLVLGVHILLMDTDEGPLRSFLARDIRQFGFRKGFRRFMERVFLPAYGNAVHSFVLGAAGFLVVIVGLRGLGMLPIELVFVALGVEFTMLLLWAVTEYFRPEQAITEPSTETDKQGEADGTPVEVRADDIERMTRALVDTTAHLALLESRLRVTESRFEQIANLDAALRELSTRLNLLVSDQLNLRVRREFEQILTELGTRAVAPGANNGTNR
ncbi:MAG TPA: hypothetical protein VF889_01320 [Bacteroidota bacterium]